MEREYEKKKPNSCTECGFSCICKIYVYLQFTSSLPSSSCFPFALHCWLSTVFFFFFHLLVCTRSFSFERIVSKKLLVLYCVSSCFVSTFKRYACKKRITFHTFSVFSPLLQLQVRMLKECVRVRARREKDLYRTVTSMCK